MYLIILYLIIRKPYRMSMNSARTVSYPVIGTSRARICLQDMRARIFLLTRSVQ